MTIVIQFQYWDLKVTDTGFEVGLSFSDVPERLEIPFSAVRGFYDPSVNFELEFDVKTEAGARGQREPAKPQAETVDARAPQEGGTEEKPAAEPPRKRAASPRQERRSRLARFLPQEVTSAVTVVNLRMARKRKARADKERQAGENRAVHGRSKAEKLRDRRRLKSPPPS